MNEYEGTMPQAPSQAPWETPKAVGAPRVEVAVGEVNSAIDTLVDVVDSLLRRIEPALTPDTPQPPVPMQPMPPKPPVSTLANSLDGLRSRVEQLSSRVAATVRRVEL